MRRAPAAGLPVPSAVTSRRAGEEFTTKAHEYLGQGDAAISIRPPAPRRRTR
jgi:hypothetical protein